MPQFEAEHVEWDYVVVLRVSDGKMTYRRHYLDVMDLMAQLGLAAAEGGV